MNVLDADNTPRVMTLREVLQAYLDHRHVVLERRTRYRLQKIDHRLEVLGGYLIAFLNLDEVIRIIREEDEPKKVMMKRWKLSDVQAEAVLNMRLRSLRKLEEIEIRQEHDSLTAERKKLKALLGSEKQRWQVIGEEIKALRKVFGPETELGKRRTELAAAPSAVVVPLEAVVEREPITILCSAKGWIRAMKGHYETLPEVRHKDGDRGRFVVPAETTNKILVFATNGRFYTLGADRLPGGRGYGEPLRLMFDLPNDQDVVSLFVYQPEQKLLVASADGRGFVVNADDVVAQTKNGKQVLNLASGVEAAVCAPVTGDSVAVVGENRKLLVFPLEELPEMARGRGVILQKYKDGGLSDAKTFEMAKGLDWEAGAGRTRVESKLMAWIGKRAQAGRLPPNGFPKSNKFSR